MADVLKVRTNKAKGFMFRPLFDLMDSGNGLFVVDITTNTVDRVGGIGDDGALSEHGNDTIDFSLFWIIGINFQQHVHSSSFIG